MTAEVKTVLNAIFVIAPKERLAELKALPGVKGVVAGRQYHLNLNRATGLVDAPGAWNALGGTGKAGAGMKIGMIDTGIDQTHPAFQDNSLSVPSGFPICKIAYPNGTEVNVPNCSDYTNHKVIVARSYAALEAATEAIRTIRRWIRRRTITRRAIAWVTAPERLRRPRESPIPAQPV